MSIFYYGIDHLTPGIALEIAQGKRKGVLSKEAIQKIERSFKAVGSILKKGEAVYGINTGFGSLCRTVIPEEDTRKLQINLLKSHACGVGKPLNPIAVRLMLVLKLHALAMGYSGVSTQTVKRILWHLENNILPIVPSKGSVGASGDLVPLAHLFLPLIGLGEVEVNGKSAKSSDILRRFHMEPISLNPKEGLALINGTQFMSALGIIALDRFAHLLDVSDITSAISIEAAKASIKPFDERLHALRPHDGSVYVARRISSLLKGSGIMKSHEHCNRVQDPYSFRCIPQVSGAAREAFLHLKSALTKEINSVTDNPVIIDENTVISGGNFHGEPIALPMDYASLAASEVGVISDRRIYLLLGGDNEGLPKMLLENSGINSGFMITQYLTAALASENKSLLFPASGDNIPTSLGQEDHVSMGSIAARKLNLVLDNLEYILSVELIAATQALEFRKPLRSSEPIEKVREFVREKIPFITEDTVLAKEIEKAKEMVVSNRLIEIVNDYLSKGENDEKFSIY